MPLPPTPRRRHVTVQHRRVFDPRVRRFHRHTPRPHRPPQRRPQPPLIPPPPRRRVPRQPRPHVMPSVQQIAIEFVHIRGRDDTGARTIGGTSTRNFIFVHPLPRDPLRKFLSDFCNKSCAQYRNRAPLIQYTKQKKQDQRDDRPTDTCQTKHHQQDNPRCIFIFFFCFGFHEVPFGVEPSHFFDCLSLVDSYGVRFIVGQPDRIPIGPTSPAPFAEHSKSASAQSLTPPPRAPSAPKAPTNVRNALAAISPTLGGPATDFLRIGRPGKPPTPKKPASAACAHPNLSRGLQRPAPTTGPARLGHRTPKLMRRSRPPAFLRFR